MNNTGPNQVVINDVDVKALNFGGNSQLGNGTLTVTAGGPITQSARIRQAINVPELAKQAIEATSRLPGRDAQSDLANVVVDPQRPADVRVLAAENLVRHAQHVVGDALLHLHAGGAFHEVVQALQMLDV